MTTRALVNVPKSAARGEVIEIVNLYRGNVIDVSKDSLLIEITGHEQKIESMIELMQPYGIRDCAFRDPAGNLVRIQELRDRR